MIPFGILGKCTDLGLGAAVPGGGPGAASGFGGNWMPGGETSGDAVPLTPLPKGMIPFGILGKRTDLDLGAAVPGGGPGVASGFGRNWMPEWGFTARKAGWRGAEEIEHCPVERLRIFPRNEMIAGQDGELAAGNCAGDLLGMTAADHVAIAGDDERRHGQRSEILGTNVRFADHQPKQFAFARGARIESCARRAQRIVEDDGQLHAEPDAAGIQVAAVEHEPDQRARGA